MPPHARAVAAIARRILDILLPPKSRLRSPPFSCSLHHRIERSHEFLYMRTQTNGWRKNAYSASARSHRRRATARALEVIIVTHPMERNPGVIHIPLRGAYGCTDHTPDRSARQKGAVVRAAAPVAGERAGGGERGAHHQVPGGPGEHPQSHRRGEGGQRVAGGADEGDRLGCL